MKGKFTKDELELIEVLLIQGHTLYRISRLMKRNWQHLYVLKDKGIIKLPKKE